MTIDAAIIILTTALDAGSIRSERTRDFAESLTAQHAGRGLSDKQQWWAIKIAGDLSAPEPAGAMVPNLPRLLANAKGRFPRLTFDTDAGRLVLKVAGERSKYAGQLMVTDGGPFGANVWYGRVDLDGRFVPARAAGDWVAQLLTALDADPAGAMADYGRESGQCCMCSRELTHGDSLAVGYGPVCADNYGLPYGEHADTEAA